VLETKRKIQVIKDDMQSPSTKGKLETDQKSALVSQRQGAPRGKYAKLEESIQQDNEEYMRGQHQQQEMIMRRQDQGLVELQETVGDLKEIGSTIGTTLETHNQMIDEVDTKVDKADSGLKGAIKKVNDLIDSTNDSTQWCIIVVLILVLVGLIVAVFYIP